MPIKGRIRPLFQIDSTRIEEKVLQRIKQVFEESGMNKSTFAENLGWSLPRLSKILNGEQTVSLSDAEAMAQALGYPLEPFVQQEFNLDEYEATHNFEVYTLSKCIDHALSWTNNIELFKDCILRQFPRTLKKVLDLNGYEFIIEGSLNAHPKMLYTVKDTQEEIPSYSPQITIRYKGITSKNNDYITMGYWFDDMQGGMALSICYIPDRKTFSTYGLSKRNYYKSLIDCEKSDRLESYPYIFQDDLRAGEIFSKVYSFTSSKMDEETLLKDLKEMFDRFVKLVQEVAQNVDVTYWQLYNDILTESGPKTVISHDDFTLEVKRMMRSGPRNPVVADIARETAGYKCECCGTDKTFTSKNGKQHFEIHHLIPLSFREQGCDYDIPENAVCLCPTCHSKIHHAVNEEKEKMIVDLYYQRKNALAEKGIDVSLAKLLKMYQL